MFLCLDHENMIIVSPKIIQYMFPLQLSLTVVFCFQKPGHKVIISLCFEINLIEIGLNHVSIEFCPKIICLREVIHVKRIYKGKIKFKRRYII